MGALFVGLAKNQLLKLCGHRKSCTAAHKVSQHCTLREYVPAYNLQVEYRGTRVVESLSLIHI